VTYLLTSWVTVSFSIRTLLYGVITTYLTPVTFKKKIYGFLNVAFVNTVEFWNKIFLLDACKFYVALLRRKVPTTTQDREREICIHIPSGIQVLKGLHVYHLYMLCRLRSHRTLSAFINIWNSWCSSVRASTDVTSYLRFRRRKAVCICSMLSCDTTEVSKEEEEIILISRSVLHGRICFTFRDSG
jgi:hypothetical protein